jgi:hypothetical protein
MHESITIAEVGDIVKVSGSRIATPLAPPEPGQHADQHAERDADEHQADVHRRQDRRRSPAATSSVHPCELQDSGESGAHPRAAGRAEAQ